MQEGLAQAQRPISACWRLLLCCCGRLWHCCRLCPRSNIAANCSHHFRAERKCLHLQDLTGEHRLSLQALTEMFFIVFSSPNEAFTCRFWLSCRDTDQIFHPILGKGLSSSFLLYIKMKWPHFHLNTDQETGAAGNSWKYNSKLEPVLQTLKKKKKKYCLNKEAVQSLAGILHVCTARWHHTTVKRTLP